MQMPVTSGSSRIVKIKRCSAKLCKCLFFIYRDVVSKFLRFIERLKERAWGEELDKLGPAGVRSGPVNLPEVVKACLSELTEPSVLLFTSLEFHTSDHITQFWPVWMTSLIDI